MNISNRFIAHINEQHLFPANAALILAVSGGLDSVVLCELCARAGFDFVIAHCNFQLRGEESERDEAFVHQLAKKYGVGFFLEKFDTGNYANANKLSVQEAARALRYEWFQKLVAQQSSASVHPKDVFLLTGHHADDNIETLLMNFFRGTGLHGLTGIPPVNQYIRRPLLVFSRDELHQFAISEGVSFVEDSSNLSSKYTRNFFRNELLPSIAAVYPSVKENLRGNIDRFISIEKLYRTGVDNIIRKLCKRRPNGELHIPVKQLLEYNNSSLVYEIISAFGFSEKQVEEVVKLFSSTSGRYVTSAGGSFRIIRHRHWLIISPVVTTQSENIIIEMGERLVKFAGGELSLEQLIPGSLSTDPSIADLDAGKIQYPLLLRKWKTADYFYPLGMKKKKKLSRFFIDLRLSKPAKENIWVIEMDKKIVWVVGHRIDDRYKLTPATQQVLRISFR